MFASARQRCEPIETEFSSFANWLLDSRASATECISFIDDWHQIIVQYTAIMRTVGRMFVYTFDQRPVNMDPPQHNGIIEYTYTHTMVESYCGIIDIVISHKSWYPTDTAAIAIIYSIRRHSGQKIGENKRIICLFSWNGCWRSGVLRNIHVDIAMWFRGIRNVYDGNHTTRTLTVRWPVDVDRHTHRDKKERACKTRPHQRSAIGAPKIMVILCGLASILTVRMEPPFHSAKRRNGV